MTDHATTAEHTELARAFDEVAFTPPQYRTSMYMTGLRALSPNAKQTFPGPALPGEDAEVVVLRGRPSGDGEWTTWRDLDLTVDDPEQVVAAYRERLPQYEFRVVRARRVYSEDVLA